MSLIRDNQTKDSSLHSATRARAHTHTLSEIMYLFIRADLAVQVPWLTNLSLGIQISILNV